MLELLALLPLFLLASGLLFTKLRTWKVSVLACLFTILLAFVAFEFTALQLQQSILEGVFLAFLPIAWIVFAAVFSFNVIKFAGGIDAIESWLSKLSEHRGTRAVLIVLSVGGFLEAIAGFGTALIIPAIFLLHLGFKPLKAAVLALLANSVPVAFGALGVPVIVASQLTELAVLDLARAVAWQLLPLGLLLPLTLLYVSQGRISWNEELLEVAIIGVSFAVAQTSTAYLLGPELAAVVGSLTSIAAICIFKEVRPSRDVLRATAPYGVLLFLVFFSKLNFDFISFFSIAAFSQTINLLTTPGTLLLLSTLIAAPLLHVSGMRLGFLALKTARMIWASVVAIIFITVLAKVMTLSGMIAQLAVALVSSTGVFYPFISPFIGALGTFITGSDTSSNILFSQLQQSVAGQIGVSDTWLVAANTSGATAGKMISPQSLAIVEDAVGLENSSAALKVTALWCLAYVFLLGLIVGLFV